MMDERDSTLQPRLPPTPAPPLYGRLRRFGDRLIYRFPPGQKPPPDAVGEAAAATPEGLDADEVAVRPVWARPLSGRGGEVALLSTDKKREVAWFPSPEALDPESRALLEEELSAGLVLPRITRVILTAPRFGHRYWKVETDRGATDFISRSPETNVIWQGPHHCVIRDVLGNCYEIEDLRALDPASRKQAMRAL